MGRWRSGEICDLYLEVILQNFFTDRRCSGEEGQEDYDNVDDDHDQIISISKVNSLALLLTLDRY